MTISPLCRPLGLVAAILSLIQGLVWIILSIMAMLIYTKSWSPSPPKLTYGQFLSNEIILTYLHGNSSKKLDINLLVEPSSFFYWIIVYLLLSVLWVTISSVLIWIIFEEKLNLLKKGYLSLGIWISIICACDLVLAILLAIDYDTIVGKLNSQLKEYDLAMKALACGVLMTLVAKGFTLWIVNLIFAILSIKFAFDIPDKVSKDDFEPIIDAFGTSTIKNEAFGIFHGLPRLPPIQSTNERLTNLNKITTHSESNIPAKFVNNSYLYSGQPDESDFDTNSVDSFTNPHLKPSVRNRY